MKHIKAFKKAQIVSSLLTTSVVVIFLFAISACHKDEEIINDLILENTRANNNIVGVSNGVEDRSPVGWASQTGYRNASTQVQIRVVAGASYSGSTMQSIIDPSNKWLTDCAGGDGAKMRSATNIFASWYRTISNKCAPPATPSTVRNNMFNAFSGSAYDATRKNMLIDQIIARYRSLSCASPNTTVATPTTDNQTLTFLQIRKQCLEWAETVGRNAGGQPRGYYAAGVTSPANYRPGMALYKTDHSHAMIIVDIYWNATGSPTKFKVAEANWGTGWMNPLGQIPWQRVTGLRELTSISGCKVVSFE